ncbi:spore coat associated protein CotJA [Anaerotignum sp.]
MKEMCRNFVCNNNRCQQRSMNTPSAIAAQPSAILPDTSMGDCSSCVMDRIGLAQAYIPSQPYSVPMEQEQSLVCGTVFSDLVMPYCSGWNLYRFRKEV